MRIKKAAVFVFAFLAAAVMNTVCYAQTVKVVLDGNFVYFPDQQPVVLGGRTLIPIRGVFDKMGYEIIWDAETKTAFLYSETEDRFIEIETDEYWFYVNDYPQFLDVPAQVINGRIMLPLRAVADAAGCCDINWDPDTKIAYIDTYGNYGTYETVPKPQTPEPETSTQQDNTGKLEYQYKFSDGVLSGSVNADAYYYYKSLPRESYPDYLMDYINDSGNREILKSIADELTRAFSEEEGYYAQYEPYAAISFVQSIDYAYDVDSTGYSEYPKYPIETLVEGNGDCEDMSMLLAGILREMGYGVCYIVYDDHIAVGIKGADDLPGTYFNYNGTRYYYVETTYEGWHIGDYPQGNPNSAYIYEIY